MHMIDVHPYISIWVQSSKYRAGAGRGETLSRELSAMAIPFRWRRATEPPGRMCLVNSFDTVEVARVHDDAATLLTSLSV
jgi:hypothetical protein